MEGQDPSSSSPSGSKDSDKSKRPKTTPIITTSSDNQEDQEPSSSSPSGSKSSDKPNLPSTVNVPAESSHFLPIEGEENFAGRQGTSSSSGNSSDNTSDEKEKKKKRSADNQASVSATTLTDSESSSELPPREKEKRRRIEYLSTAKGGLKTTNEKLVEENENLRKTIEAIKEEQTKKN